MNDQQTSQPNVLLPLYVTLILDESGSMESCVGAALAGFNQYLASPQREPAETLFTLTLFNTSKPEVRCQTVPVATLPELTLQTYRPQAGTPLYDAIGCTLAQAMRDAPAEARKLRIILTDGLENASSEYRREQVFDLIKKCEEQGWAFLYLGADHDVWAAGGDLGITGDGRISFCCRTVDDTFDQLSETTADYRRGKRLSEAASRLMPETPSKSKRSSKHPQLASSGHEREEP